MCWDTQSATSSSSSSSFYMCCTDQNRSSQKKIWNRMGTETPRVVSFDGHQIIQVDSINIQVARLSEVSLEFIQKRFQVVDQLILVRDNISTRPINFFPFLRRITPKLKRCSGSFSITFFLAGHPYNLNSKVK